MNAEQIMLVQSSWADVEPLAGKLGELMYRRIFELDPSLREKFPSDPRQQGEILMSMLGGAVNLLFRIDTLEPSLRELGKRHNRYGARPGDYKTFQTALLWTLSRLLGPAFTAEMSEAWASVFDFLAARMITAQQETS